MTTLRFADTHLGLRQSIATGRFYEAFTERGFGDFSATLAWSHAGAAGVFRTALLKKHSGYFALQLNPQTDMPDLSSAGAVDLTLTLERPGEPPIDGVVSVTGAQLAVVEDNVNVGEASVTVLRIAAAPFAFEIALQPDPVLLDGLVLFDNDPETPAANVSVSATGMPTVNTGPDGRFRVRALPVDLSIMLTFDDGSNETLIPIFPDYTHATMNAVFSIPSP